MRILMFGAGGVGGYFGGRLRQAGADVTFAVRPRRASQLAADGLVVESPHGNFVLPPSQVAYRDSATLGPDYDVIVLACKAYDLDEAMSAVAPAVGPQAIVIPLLNGIAHIDLLQTQFGARVAGGSCGVPATLTPGGTVVHLGKVHRITFGPLPGTDAAAAPLLAALREAFAQTPVDVALSEDIVLNMWEKFIGLATLAAMTCLMRSAVGDIVATDEGLALMHETLQVCVDTAAAAGRTPRPKALEGMRRMVGEAGSPATASMLRDLEAGHRNEGAHIVGDMLGRARAAGIDPGPLRVAWCHLQAAAQRQRREHPSV